MSSPLENLFSIYTEEPKGTDELEVKFFTKTSANLSRIDFNNVIQGVNIIIADQCIISYSVHVL